MKFSGERLSLKALQSKRTNVQTETSSTLFDTIALAFIQARTVVIKHNMISGKIKDGFDRFRFGSVV